MLDHQPRLMYVVNSLPFLASHRKEIVFAARDLGYRVAIACAPDPMVAVFEAEGFEVFPLPLLVRGSTSPLRELRAMHSIRKPFAIFKPDIVHLITLKPVIYGGLMARLSGIPSLSAISGLGYVFTGAKLKQRLLKPLVIRGYRAALGHDKSHAVFQNTSDLDLFLANRITCRERTTLIPGSGANLEYFTPQPLPQDGPTVALLPARMLRDKGVGEFLEAADALRDERPDILFRLLGDPDPMNPTSFSAEELRAATIRPNVEWRPHNSDIAAELAQAHLVVLPSYREGFSKTLIDAAAAGRAVATSDAPGCRDAIREGVTGALFRAADSGDLMRVVAALCSDRERLQRMGVAGRALAEAEFDVRRIVATHCDLYDLLLRRKLKIQDKRST